MESNERPVPRSELLDSAPALVPVSAVNGKPQVELTPRIARAVQNSIQRVNSLDANAKAAQMLFQQVAAIHAEFISALVEQGGLKMENFPAYGVDETDGKFCLKAQ